MARRANLPLQNGLHKTFLAQADSQHHSVQMPKQVCREDFALWHDLHHPPVLCRLISLTARLSGRRIAMSVKKMILASTQRDLSLTYFN